LPDQDAVKAAAIMFTKDLAKDEILVHAVCPGPTRTPLRDGPGGLGEQPAGMLGVSGQEAIPWLAAQDHSPGRVELPEEVAAVVTFLTNEPAIRPQCP
jgi:3-oxoacyl-[acyl-carrier protein] reductase